MTPDYHGSYVPSGASVKRDAPSSTKMKRLCRLLDIPLHQAVGLLELLWHLTAREAPRGNIGKLSNETIALALDYRGDEDRLVDAWIRTGWLDEDREYRLIVHDWHEHADEAVKKRLTRSGQSFVSARRVETKPPNVETKEQVGNLPRAGAGPVPVPVPVPHPGPEPVSPSALAQSVKKPRSAQEPPTVFDLPLIGGKNYGVPQTLYDVFRESYPGVSVMAELGRMRAWLVANPTKMKTINGLPRFMNSWLAKEQNKGGHGGTNSGGANNGEPRGAAVGRVQRGVAAVARAAERLGLTGDGGVLPASGYGGRGGESRGAAVGRVERTQNAFRQAARESIEAAGLDDDGPDRGEDTQPADSEDRAAARSSQPEILPPSRRSRGGTSGDGNEGSNA
jgi:hypothetical protein